MPRRDGTGPVSAGAMTGRGLGHCVSPRNVGNRAGFRPSCGHGYGRGFGFNEFSSRTQKEMLNEQKTLLQDRLKAIDKQLENL